MVKRSIIGALVHIVAWYAGFVLLLYVFAHSDAKVVIAVVAAWWASLYVGYVFRVPLLSAPFVFVLYEAYGVLALVFKWNFYYHIIPADIDCRMVAITLFRSFLFSSPILVNSVVGYLKTRFGTAGGTAARTGLML